MAQINELGIILNPNAGRGKALRVEKEILNCLRKKNIKFHLEHTKEPCHATMIAKNLVNQFDIVIAAGGDGTAHEVACGVLGSKASLAYLPIGSGNDFNKIVGMPKDITNAVDLIIQGKRKQIDVGNISILNNSKRTVNAFFFNTLGMGIDATIAKEARQIKHIRGLVLYLIAAIKALTYFTPIHFSVRIDGREMNEESFLFCIGNGKFEGGGFNMVPNALPDDQVFDICLIKKMPIKQALIVIPMVIKGTHGNHKKVYMSKAKDVKLIANDPFIVHADGEIIEDQAIELEARLAKEKLSVIIA